MPNFYEIEFTNCYQMTTLSYFKSQLCINRFFYEAAAAFTGGLMDLIEAWCDEVLPVFTNIQHSSVNYSRAEVLALFGTRQKGEFSLVGTNGLLSGDPVPAFFGARYRMYPADTRVRKGRKIWAGIVEQWIDGDQVSGSFTTEIEAVEDKLIEVLNLEGLNWQPVLLSPANTRHTGNLIVPITVAEFVGWSTQNSRKIGRGA